MRDRIDRIAPEFHAQGKRAVGREKIDNPAAPGKLPCAINGFRPDIARREQRFYDGVRRPVFTGLQRHSAGIELLRRKGQLHGGLNGADHHAVFALQHMAEHAEPLLLIFAGLALRRAKMKIPGRIEQRAALHRVQIFYQTAALGLVRNDDHGPAALVLAKGVNEMGLVNQGNPRHAGGKPVFTDCIFDRFVFCACVQYF